MLIAPPPRDCGRVPETEGRGYGSHRLTSYKATIKLTPLRHGAIVQALRVGNLRNHAQLWAERFDTQGATLVTTPAPRDW